MILTDKQKSSLIEAVDQHITYYDPSIVTLFRSSNKKLQLYLAFGTEARYIQEKTGMTLSRKEEFPWSLGYAMFSSGGYRTLEKALPKNMTIDIVHF